MRVFIVIKLNVKIIGSFQFVYQVDGLLFFIVLGEIRFYFICGGYKFYFEGFVVENLDMEVLVGILFMEMNDIFICFFSCEVCIGNKYVYMYGLFVF